MVIPERTERKNEPYPDYKDSGVEWLGGIPAHWDAKRLRFLTWINPSKGEIKGLPPSLEISFIPMEDVGCGVLNMEKTQELDSVSEGYTYFRDGDVLVAKITPCFENGKGAIGEGLLNSIGFGTTELHVIRSTPDLNRCFLLYITVSYAFRKIGESEMYGAAGQKRVPDKFIRDFICPYPSQREQQAIADFLDRETARIDEMIAREQRLVDLLQEQRTTLITCTVTKGLNPDAPMKYSGVEWLGKIPEHWEVKKLKHVLLRNDGGVWGDDYDENGTIVLRSTEQTIGGEWCINEPAIRRINAKEYKKSKLIYGDLLITKSSGSESHIGKTTLVTKKIEDMNCCFSNFMQRIRLLSNYSAKYVYYVFNCILGREQLVYYSNTTTGLANLSSTIIGNIHVAMPNYSEQQAITDYLDQETSRIDDLVGRIIQAIEKLQEYRSALITAAVTGKIDVRQQVS